MPLDRSALRNLAAILRGDLEAIERLSALLERFGGALDLSTRDSDHVWAAAMALHHLYNALEHSFERIARTCDEWVADQARWHRDLLSRMFLDLPGVRPAVLSSALRGTLEELLAFRHFVRHAYDAALEPRQIALVISFWRDRHADLKQQMETFIGFLERAIQLGEP